MPSTHSGRTSDLLQSTQLPNCRTGFCSDLFSDKVTVDLCKEVPICSRPWGRTRGRAQSSDCLWAVFSGVLCSSAKGRREESLGGFGQGLGTWRAERLVSFTSSREPGRCAARQGPRKGGRSWVDLASARAGNGGSG